MEQVRSEEVTALRERVAQLENENKKLKAIRMGIMDMITESMIDTMAGYQEWREEKIEL